MSTPEKDFMGYEAMSREFGMSPSHTSGNPQNFSYTQRELFHNFNITIENIDNLQQPLATLLDRANNLKREKEELEKKVRRTESELKNANSVAIKHKNDYDMFVVSAKEKERKQESKIEELEKDLVRSRAKIGAMEKEFLKKEKDLNTKMEVMTKEPAGKTSFLVVNKQPKTPEKESFNFTDVLKESAQMQLESFRDLITALFSLFDYVNNRLISCFNFRKAYLLEECDVAQQELSSLPIWSRLVNMQIRAHDNFDMESLQEITQSFSDTISFMDNFDEIVSDGFRDFVASRKIGPKGEIGLNMESVFRTRQYAKIKDVVELQEIVEKYVQVIQHQKRQLELNRADIDEVSFEIELSDEDQPAFVGNKVSTDCFNSINEIGEFLVRQEGELQQFKKQSKSNGDMIQQEINSLKNTTSFY